MSDIFIFKYSLGKHQLYILDIVASLYVLLWSLIPPRLIDSKCSAQLAT